MCTRLPDELASVLGVVEAVVQGPHALVEEGGGLGEIDDVELVGDGRGHAPGVRVPHGEVKPLVVALGVEVASAVHHRKSEFSINKL